MRADDHAAGAKPAKRHAAAKASGAKPVGTVAFIGAGPGDPGLLTVRAVEVLGAADVVVGVARAARGRDRALRPRRRRAGGHLGGGLLRHRAGPGARSATPATAARSCGSSAATRSSRATARRRRPRWPRPRSPSRSCRASPARHGGAGLRGRAADLSQGARGARRRRDARSNVDWDTLAQRLGDPGPARGRELARRGRRAAGGRRPPAATPVAVTVHGTTTSQQTVVTTLGRLAARRRRRSSAAAPAGRRRGRRGRRPARQAVVVRDQAAVRLAGAGAAHQGAGRRAVRAAALLRRGAATRCRPSRSSRRAPRSRWSAPSRAWSPAATSGSRFTSVNAVQGGAREVRGVRPRRPRVRRAQGRRRRRADRRRRCATWGIKPDLVPDRRAVRAPACSRTGRRTTTVLDPINRVFLPRADIATETLVAGLRRAGLGGRRRHRLPHRARRAAGRADPRGDQGRRVRRGRLHLVLDRAQPRRHRRQAAHRRRSSPASARPTAKTAEEHGLRVDVLAPERRRVARAGRRAGRLRRRSLRASLPPRPASRCCGPSRAPARRARPRPAEVSAMALPGRSAAPPAAARRPALRRLVAETRLRPGRAGAAGVRRARASTEPVADRVDAGRRAAHPRLAAQGRRRGGRGRASAGSCCSACPRRKDAVGSGATDPDGILNVALARRASPRSATTLVVMADLCLDEFTDHGHCGVLDADGRVDNDATLERYAEMALAQADAGAHVVGPSGMMDGQVGVDPRGARRRGPHRRRRSSPTPRSTPPRFYGPFREAVELARCRATARPTSRTRPTPREALREVRARPRRGRRHGHGQAGAALPRRRCARSRDAVDVPVAAYQVSGEYAMVEAAAANGWIDRDARDPRDADVDPAGRRRHGATYWAAEVAGWLAR